MPRAILCGADRSAGGHAAALLGAALAERLGLRLILLHAVPVAVPPHADAFPHALALIEATGVRTLRETVETIDDRQAATVVIQGTAARALVAGAAATNAAFVVVGSRALGSLSEAVRGSVSARVAREAPCPVMIVPPAAAASGETLESGAEVLCGVEGRGDAGPAAVAAELARGLGMRLTLAHVLEPATGGRVASTEHTERLALAELHGVVERLTRRPPVKVRIPRGRAGDRLAAQAREERAALVVVGSRGRGPLRAALLGSTSRRLVRASDVPVVVCPRSQNGKHGPLWTDEREGTLET